MLNSNQVKELFEKEAILIGSKDAVPLYRVRELFGDRAAGFAIRSGGWGNGNSLFGVGDFQLPYVTFSGFQNAASYANVEEIRETVGASADWGIEGQVEDSLIPGYIMDCVDTLRSKYPDDTSWGIISEVMGKAAKAETRRKQKKEAFA